MAKHFDNRKLVYFRRFGELFEELVMNITVSNWGGHAQKSTIHENIYDHIDFFWQDNNNSYLDKGCSFDVKAPKKNNRSDKYASADETWLELQGTSGHPGSLCGKENYLVFCSFDDIIYCDRNALYNECMSRIDKNNVYTDQRPSSFFSLYSRKKYGENDLIFKVPISFLKEKAKYIVKIEQDHKTWLKDQLSMLNEEYKDIENKFVI